MVDWAIYLFCVSTPLLLFSGLAFTVRQFRRAGLRPRRVRTGPGRERVREAGAR
jgi:hypothetical protein